LHNMTQICGAGDGIGYSEKDTDIS